ncbi:MAG: hypothetical protein JXB38_21275 [Anaerolineales bacterium]|nr:hypothetical protein [Anaerolineales bacterium]
MTYRVHLHRAAFQAAERYLHALQTEQAHAGAYLWKLLDNTDRSQLSPEAFLELLINTKHPQIYAESALSGDGSDWNQTELAILGDVGISVPVTVFDNGRHVNPEVHAKPFAATLLYVPGALLHNGRGYIPADWHAVVRGDEIYPQAYYRLYESRLLPLFVHANRVSTERDKAAFITIPGLGCGQFAGPFRGTLAAKLKAVLVQLLENYQDRFPNIRAVYFDPYRECENERIEIGHISFFVRPLTQGNEAKPQLCSPNTYAEANEDFRDCELFSFVAWDHVSWPGNDFYVGSRATDDGVKAAATNSMAVMTGIAGRYHHEKTCYEPPQGYATWGDVVHTNQIRIRVQGNLSVVPG